MRGSAAAEAPVPSGRGRRRRPTSRPPSHPPPGRGRARRRGRGRAASGRVMRGRRRRLLRRLALCETREATVGGRAPAGMMDRSRPGGGKGTKARHAAHRRARDTLREEWKRRAEGRRGRGRRRRMMNDALWRRGGAARACEAGRWGADCRRAGGGGGHVVLLLRLRPLPLSLFGLHGGVEVEDGDQPRRQALSPQQTVFPYPLPGRERRLRGGEGEGRGRPCGAAAILSDPPLPRCFAPLNSQNRP
jgi:hypothetical protein